MKGVRNACGNEWAVRNKKYKGAIGDAGNMVGRAKYKMRHKSQRDAAQYIVWPSIRIKQTKGDYLQDTATWRTCRGGHRARTSIRLYVQINIYGKETRRSDARNGRYRSPTCKYKADGQGALRKRRSRTTRPRKREAQRKMMGIPSGDCNLAL